MIEKGKISSFQMGVIMYPTILATAILLVPAITAEQAKRDNWLSPIWASLLGLFVVFIAVRLNKKYPDKTIVEAFEAVAGRWFGKALGLAFLLFLFHNAGIIVREYGEFVAGNFLNRTPLTVIMGTMVLVCAMNVRGGLEVLGRSAQMFVPIVLILFMCIVILLIPDLHPENMFPMLEDGLMPSLRGSMVPQAWFSEFILISFMMPYVMDKEKGMKWGVLSVVIVMLTMVITNFASLFLFGEITSIFTYPVMVAARFISIADFFEHLETLVMAIWVMGTFVKISAFYYAIVIGTAQLLKLSDYRPLTLPIGFLLVTFSAWVASSLQDLVYFIRTTAPVYFFTFQTAIPTLLLIAAVIRNKVQRNKGAANA
jgi:spore germination protein KB